MDFLAKVLILVVPEQILGPIFKYTILGPPNFAYLWGPLIFLVVPEQTFGLIFIIFWGPKFCVIGESTYNAL